MPSGGILPRFLMTSRCLLPYHAFLIIACCLCSFVIFFCWMLLQVCHPSKRSACVLSAIFIFSSSKHDDSLWPLLCCVYTYMITNMNMTFQGDLSLACISKFYFHLISRPIFCSNIGPLPNVSYIYSNWLLLLHCFAAAAPAVTWKSIVKTEKKTVQFSEDIQVETIEPEQEPVYIDEVSSLVSTLTYSLTWDLTVNGSKCQVLFQSRICYLKTGTCWQNERQQIS